jgi:CHASE3 domain sensor protein
MLRGVVVAMGMVTLGLYLVYQVTQTAERTGERRPLLRKIG